MGLFKNVEKIDKKLSVILDRTESFTKENNWKIKKHDELNEYLKYIKLGVKDVKLVINDNGLVGLEIEYQAPTIKVFLDEDGTVMKNNCFYAINMLNMIPFDDMSKITLELDKAKQINKGGTNIGK